MNLATTYPVFSQNTLDRMDHLRADILDHRLSHLSATTDRYLLLVKGQVLLAKTAQNNPACFFTADQLSEVILRSEQCIFLGEDKGLRYFTLGLSEALFDQRFADRREDFTLIGIRDFVAQGLLPDQQLGLLAEANSLLNWHASHGFCARCGTQSVAAHGGWRRDCPSCQAEHFPRTDPVVIMLVTHGDQCLLGRGHQFDERRFSCLAGFMEPGETIVQAALRELWEEAGIKGSKVTFLFDQPWPFPSNLMIGVHVEVDSDDLSLTVDHNELAEVMWVNKTEVKAVLEGDENQSFLLPPRVAIARDLLAYYVGG